MSATEISSLGTKMGLSSPRVLRKAKEYCQLLEIRNSGCLSAMKLPATCNTVACLELAACTLNHYVDKNTVVRVSGTTKKLYMMCLKTIESILEIQNVRSIRDMAVQFGCTPAVELAQKVLKRYIDAQCQSDAMDFNTSLFQGAALCAACKHQKVKVDRSKVKEMCAVKSSCFDTLVAEMDKIIQTMAEEKKENLPKKRGSTLLDEIERQMQELPEKKPRNTDEDKEEADTAQTNYEEWKRKILENAAKANS